jgi:hypothetical protein
MEVAMTLNDLRAELLKDMGLDETALDSESLRIPQLHGKYLNFLFDERLLLSKYEGDLARVTRVKWEYYTGKMSDEELKQRGLEPFQLKVLRQDISVYMDSDEDVIKARQRLQYQREKISLLEEVIKELNNRHWKIRNAIEWRKFTSGQ